MEHTELILDFPNVVAHQIIHILSFLDLFRFQGVSKTRKDLIECGKRRAGPCYVSLAGFVSTKIPQSERIVSKSRERDLTTDRTTTRAVLGMWCDQMLWSIEGIV
jgi:hypothetical protein